MNEHFFMEIYLADTPHRRNALHFGGGSEQLQNMKVLFLELAVGYNTPTIVKYSFWRMAHDWKDSSYACLNYGEAYAPDEIRKKSICINGEIGEILSQI